MCVKRSVAKTAAASVEETTAPSRIDSSQERSKRQYAATPVRTARDDDADGAQERRGHGDLAQPPPRGLRPPSYRISASPTTPTSPGELGVVELDPARPVRAEQHPEREERDERRAPRARGDRARRRCSPPGRRRRAGAEGPRPRSYLSRWESLPRRGTLPGWRLDRARARWAGSRRSRRWPSGTASATSSSGTSSPTSFRGRRGSRRAPSRPPARSAGGTCARCSTSSARRSSSSASCSRPGPTSSRRTSSPSCAGCRTT